MLSRVFAAVTTSRGWAGKFDLKKEALGWCLVRDSSSSPHFWQHGDVFNSSNSSTAPFFCKSLTPSAGPSHGPDRTGANPCVDCSDYLQHRQELLELLAKLGGVLSCQEREGGKELSGRQQLPELLTDLSLNAAGLLLERGWNIRQLSTVYTDPIKHYLNGKREISGEITAVSLMQLQLCRLFNVIHLQPENPPHGGLKSHSFLGLEGTSHY